MTHRISKQFRFEAAHRLRGLPEGHKCMNLHGHSYRFEVVCEGELDDRSFVIDYAEIKDAVQPIVDQLDHSVLCDENDSELAFHAHSLGSDVTEIDGQTSAETLARWLYEQIELDCLHSVIVYETCTTSVVYSP